MHSWFKTCPVLVEWDTIFESHRLIAYRKAISKFSTQLVAFCL